MRMEIDLHHTHSLSRRGGGTDWSAAYMTSWHIFMAEKRSLSWEESHDLPPASF
jgi:hypothetical protein